MYRTKLNLIGKKFGNLIVIAESPIRRKGNHVQWFCKCVCGNICTKIHTMLYKTPNINCGCIKYSSKRHGHSNDNFYSVWQGMLQRCTNKNHIYYEYYGGKGITVCDRWNYFDNFLEDMFSGYAQGLTLDRIETDKNYNKDNCKWSTMKEQSLNKSNNIILNTPKGKMTMREAADKFSIIYSTLRSRVRARWPEEKLFIK